MKTLPIALLCIVSAPAFAADPVVVDQKNRAFGAGEIHIHSGDTVRFNNKDDFGHQVYAHSPAFSFDTDESDPGNHVDVRFPTKGHYRVQCHIHPKMRMDVDVD